MTNLFQTSVAIAALALTTACATTNDAADNRNIQLGTDGSYAVTDGNGNPVNDPDDPAAALAALLGAEMAKQNDLSDEEIWAEDAEGNKTHIQSGGICPKEWGSFEINRATIFNRQGTDVGCNYQSDVGAAFTFYYFKAAESAETHAQSAFDNVELRNPTGKPTELLFPMAFANHQVYGEQIKSTSSDGVDFNDGLYVVETDGWLVKMRVTYLTGRAATIEPMMQGMYIGAIDSVTPNGYSPKLDVQPGDEDKLGT